MYEFSRHPKAIPFLEENLDKINWCGLSGNPDAIPLLLKYPENIVWGRQLYTYAY
jgi:hypothetical protein